MSASIPPPSNPPEPLAAYRVGLNACPQCNYPLRGLADTGSCPECGFVYDPDTLVVEGIARGTSGMSPVRVVLWLFIGFGAWLASALLRVALQLQTGLGSVVYIAIGGLGIVWLALLIFLLMTGKRKGEQTGRQRFLFAAGGFGNCAGQDPSQPVEMRLILWRDVNTVTVESKGANFQRLRIGIANPPGGPMYQVSLDAGIGCSVAQATAIQQVLQHRIASASRQSQDFNAPGPDHGMVG